MTSLESSTESDRSTNSQSPLGMGTRCASLRKLNTARTPLWQKFSHSASALKVTAALAEFSEFSLDKVATLPAQLN